MLSNEVHFRFKDTHAQSKGIEKDILCKWKLKVGVGVLTLEEKDFMSKL